MLHCGFSSYSPTILFFKDRNFPVTVRRILLHCGEVQLKEKGPSPQYPSQYTGNRDTSLTRALSQCGSHEPADVAYSLVCRTRCYCFPAVLSPTRLFLFLSGRSHYLLPWERNSLKLPSFRHSGSPRQAALPLPPPPWGLTT